MKKTLAIFLTLMLMGNVSSQTASEFRQSYAADQTVLLNIFHQGDADWVHCYKARQDMPWDCIPICDGKLSGCYEYDLYASGEEFCDKANGRTNAYGNPACGRECFCEEGDDFYQFEEFDIYGCPDSPCDYVGWQCDGNDAISCYMIDDCPQERERRDCDDYAQAIRALAAGVAGTSIDNIVETEGYCEATDCRSRVVESPPPSAGEEYGPFLPQGTQGKFVRDGWWGPYATFNKRVVSVGETVTITTKFKAQSPGLNSYFVQGEMRPSGSLLFWGDDPVGPWTFSGDLCNNGMQGVYANSEIGLLQDEVAILNFNLYPTRTGEFNLYVVWREDCDGVTLAREMADGPDTIAFDPVSGQPYGYAITVTELIVVSNADAGGPGGNLPQDEADEKINEGTTKTGTDNKNCEDNPVDGVDCIVLMRGAWVDGYCKAGSHCYNYDTKEAWECVKCSAYFIDKCWKFDASSTGNKCKAYFSESDCTGITYDTESECKARLTDDDRDRYTGTGGGSTNTTIGKDACDYSTKCLDTSSVSICKDWDNDGFKDSKTFRCKAGENCESGYCGHESEPPIPSDPIQNQTCEEICVGYADGYKPKDTSLSTWKDAVEACKCEKPDGTTIFGFGDWGDISTEQKLMWAVGIFAFVVVVIVAIVMFIGMRRKQ